MQGKRWPSVHSRPAFTPACTPQPLPASDRPYGLLGTRLEPPFRARGPCAAPTPPTMAHLLYGVNGVQHGGLEEVRRP